MYFSDLVMKRTSGILIVIIFWGIGFLFSGCTPIKLHEQNTRIPGFKWQHNYTVKGSFIISDTVSSYNIYVVLRHTDNYRYSNIWLNLGFQDPGDSMRIRKINLPLADDAGGWEGSGMNDIWEMRKLIFMHKFSKPGEYRYEINQIMRDNPLPGIMSVGIRVEKNGSDS